MGGQIAGVDRADPRMTYSCLWPGLCALWFQGAWRGLGVALAFAVVLNATILTTLVWDEWLGSTANVGLWCVTGAFWIVGLIVNRRLARLFSQPTDDRASPGDLFPDALTEYLQGNWIAVEQTCRALIEQRREDAEARLLLATTLRRSGRRDEARRTLEELTKFDSADRWNFEIARERRLLDVEPPEELEESNVAAGEEAGHSSDVPTRRAA